MQKSTIAICTLTMIIGNAAILLSQQKIKERWFKVADLNTPHQNHAVVVVHGKIYAVGGYDRQGNEIAFEEYHPESDRWKILPNMPTPRFFLAAAAVKNRIYAIGGMSDSVAYHATVEAYDLANRRWMQCADLLTPRNRFAAVAFSGKIYAIGGMIDREKVTPEHKYRDTGIVEVYDPVEDKWVIKTQMPTPRHAHAAVVVNDKIFVIGGFQIGGAWPSAIVEAYDPVKDFWERKADMPTQRGFFGAAVVKGYIYAIAGRGQGAPVERYDPQTDQWQRIGTAPEWRNRFGIGVVDDMIYVIGGEPPPDDRRMPFSVLRYEPE